MLVWGELLVGRPGVHIISMLYTELEMIICTTYRREERSRYHFEGCDGEIRRYLLGKFESTQVVIDMVDFVGLTNQRLVIVARLTSELKKKWGDINIRLLALPSLTSLLHVEMSFLEPP